LSFNIEYKLDVDFEEIYKKLAKFVAASEWSINREAEVLILEDGKNFSYGFVVGGFILGLLTLWLFFLGILIWIFTVIYAATSSPHRISITKENNSYRVYANSEKGISMLRPFFASLGAEEIPRYRILKTGDLYNRLLDSYVSIYGSFYGKKKLEDELNRLMSSGASKDEAIRTIYRKQFGKTG